MCSYLKKNNLLKRLRLFLKKKIKEVVRSETEQFEYLIIANLDSKKGITFSSFHSDKHLKL